MNTDQPTPQTGGLAEFAIQNSQFLQPEPARGEWRVGRAYAYPTLTCYVVIFENEHGVAKAYGNTPQEAEATAKKICEDHNRVAFLEAAVDCGASGWTETLKKFKASIDEVKKLREENQKLRAEVEALKRHD